MIGMPDADRPQDVGRAHRRKGAPSAATAALLTEYHDTMRGELRAVLGELAPVTETSDMFPDLPAVTKRPPLRERMQLWDLAIKLGRELGSAIDVPDPGSNVAGPGPRRRGGRADYGGA